MYDDKILKKIYEKGYFISVDAYPLLNNFSEKEIEEIIKNLEAEEGKIDIISKEILEKYINKLKEREKSLEKNKLEEVLIHEKVERYVGEEYELPIEVLRNYDSNKNEITINTWISYFKSRLNKIKKILNEHLDLKNSYSISNIPKKEKIAISGIIYDKKITEKGVYFIVEDNTGKIKVFVGNNVKNYKLIKDIPADAVVGFIGRLSGNLFFAEQVIFPDVPNRMEVKKGNLDAYIVLTGDFQIGSKLFIKKAFERFILFLKGEYGDEKLREISKKVGYLLIVGDNVDGVGIYPDQENELEIVSYEKQYKEFEKYMLEIPEHIKIAIIPGNHDIVRTAEPQPPIPKEYLHNLYGLKNIFMLSNPCYLKIDNLIVLMYHGYSFDWFVSDISTIRESGGYENPAEIMKFSLMLRHLNPHHGASPYVPYFNDDPLVIDIVPDIYHTGHIHRAAYQVYRGIEMFNTSTFQDITKYQLELGHRPVSGIVYLRNIKTGEVIEIDFINETIKRLKNNK
ncbi:MAG: metallophosphoesterase [Nanopusillaceae archaeon]